MPESRVTPAQRLTVAERAKHCCEHCRSQERYSPDSFAVEFIAPLSKEGRTVLENLAFACQGCNKRKYISVSGIYPVTQQPVSLYHPRQQSWGDHFAWDAGCSSIIRLSPTGRATIEKLRLNCVGLVNLRRVLFAIGEYPPTPINPEDDAT